MRHTLPWLLLGLLASAGALPARADEPTPQEVERLERAVYLGRVHDAWGLLEDRASATGTSQLAWLLWDWRRWGGQAPAVEPEGTHQALSRVLRALNQERAQRETRGLAGLPTESPLAALDDPEGLHAAFLGLQRELYAPSASERAAGAERADALRASAYRLAAIAVAACLMLAAALATVLRKRR